MADKNYPARGDRDWYNDLREYLEPDAAAVTLTTGKEITYLGSVNEWTVPAPVTVTLPDTPLGSAVTVFISNLSRITWPAGTTVMGASATTTEAVVTLMRLPTGWRVLVAGTAGGGGGGLPRYNAAHPLFSNVNNTSLADFNDFFGLNLTARPSQDAMYPYLGSDGGIWVMYRPYGSDQWRYTTLSMILHQLISMSPLKSGTSSSNPLTKPPGLAPGAGFTPVVTLAVLDILGYPTDWRESRFQMPMAAPTAVTDFAALAPYSGDPSTDVNRILPYGTSVFVMSLGKPLWKKSATQWVDGTGAVVSSG